jgi:1,4-alpha-glucan branching enzyme
VNYVVSHDERRPEYEIQFWAQHVQPGKRESQFSTRWELALQKARLGLAVLLTSPGVPMLLAGQEFGEDSPRTIDFRPLDWAKLETEAGRRQHRYLRQLLELRRAHPALRSDFVEFYWDDFPRYKLVRYKRWDNADDIVVIAANFDNVAQKAGLGFPLDGWWRNALTGQRAYIKGHWRDFVVPAWSALILVPDR